MPAITLLKTDDLRLWRACERRYWLHRQRRLSGAGDADGGKPGPGVGSAAIGDTSAAAGEPGAPTVPAQQSGATPADTPATYIVRRVGRDADMVRGMAPDAAVRASFPGAAVIPTPHTSAEWEQAVLRTAACLDAGALDIEGATILGACLASDDGALVRIDVLTRGPLGLRLLKVRHATVGDEADVDAVALWTHVAARCGLRLQGLGLMLVDTDFVYPGHGCYAGLFREVDLAPVLGSRPVAAWLTAMQAGARCAEPASQPGPRCALHGGCEFTERCEHHAGEGAACDASPAVAVADPRACLEIVGRELAAELREEGFVDLHGVPLQRVDNERKRRALRAVQQHAPVFEPQLAGLVRALPWPRHFLRIDTIGFAVPIWPGTRPYQVLPFQWTCDVLAGPAAPLVRHHFLADAAGGDPRRAFAESLLQVLGESGGAVLAYNAGFERNRIRELAVSFDDLNPALEALLPRIVDLFQIAREHYYDPALCGRWSFRSVMGAVAPGLRAGVFDRRDPTSDAGHAGSADDDVSAQSAFARSLRRDLDAATREQLRARLVAHGQREAEALRRLVTLFEAGGEPVALAARVVVDHRA